MTKKEFVKSEREFTVELLKHLDEKEWQAKTLCKGWSVEDLTAHLVSRERSAIGGLGIVVPALSGLHERRIARLEAKGHGYIINKLSHYPWWMPAVLNTAEFWVHNEDMLRGELDLKRPTPDGECGEILWGSLGGLVRVKKDMVADLGNVTIHNTQSGEEIKLRSRSDKQTTIIGAPGELLMYFYGRREVAKVSISK